MQRCFFSIKYNIIQLTYMVSKLLQEINLAVMVIYGRGSVNGYTLAPHQEHPWIESNEFTWPGKTWLHVT